MINVQLRRVSIYFVAGCFGALINSWMVWYLGRKGIPKSVGVMIAPEWSRSFLYPRIVWGGLWGLVFILPVWGRGFGFGTAVLGRGLVLSLFPTAFQLLYVFPTLLGKGMFGLSLGRLAPLFVLFYNAVWGICAAFWIHMAESKA